MNIMNNYVGDELANKVKILSLALADAKNIIEKLEQENDQLKMVLVNSIEHNNDLVLDSEVLYS